ncbi:hypothetical protein, partial [Vibrio owensii]|uniref:hypothetical protein n=1 Tax=Vibrio owensii TaxID=696485 RepID=UPI0022DE1031
LSVMRCTFLLIVLGRTASTDYTATSFLFHTPEISIALIKQANGSKLYSLALQVIHDVVEKLQESNNSRKIVEE